ncbi:MAG: O-acetylhomoserine aminocarboxypropyltransferase/cysteine synthase [Spirochaetaceae bacterium]|nr:O-acetylhomoserine aminocarboxypropyltransferase/cysteine synthase [Spirochaetaceae bacterium]
MGDFTTRAINPSGKLEDGYKALRPPLYDSLAFEFESSRDIQLAFEGRKNEFAYSRVSKPTMAELENRIKDLSGSIGVLALSSGMAAISNTVLALAGAGTNGVIAKTLFGNSVSLFKETLGPWGFESRFVDITDQEAVEASIDTNTRFIFLEIISNPQIEVANIREIVETGNKYDVPVILDGGTLTTPYIFNAKDAGVSLELISSTKYISGGATSTGGLILDYGNFDWKKMPCLEKWSKAYGPLALMVRLRREVYRNIGACLAPRNAWLQSLGLETLGLRIDKSCENAMAVSEWLNKNDKVKRVDYPGLKSNEYHSISAEQFGDKFGGILTFDHIDKDVAYRFMDSLKLIRRATNLNDNKSLIIHPTSTIFSEYSLEECEKMGVRETLIRLSVGIENYRDLIRDIEQALENI